jgi:ribosomal protein S18 acetylase RimI-like enzyme
MMVFHIRRATPRDIKAILPVWGELAAYHANLDPSFTPARAWAREYGAYLRTLMDRDDTLAIVARDVDAVIGYAVGRISTLPPFFEHRYRGYIHDGYTREGFRRRGIGRKLVEELFAWFRRRGVTFVELTVAANNTEALPFWQRLGFETYMHHMKRVLS